MTETILVVDDEPRVVRLVTHVLRSKNYRVLTAADGAAALEILAVEQPNLVLLDIMLDAGSDGYAVCRQLREFSDVPVIMLTAKARDADILAGFDAGADDYLTKPFNSQELLARVRVLLRRSQRHEEIMTAPRQCGDIEMDLTRYTLRVRGEPVALTRTEFALLRELMLNANRVVLHQTLLTRVWGAEYRNDMDYLRAYVRYLRRKIERDPAQPQYILTASGIGYMLKCPTDAPPTR
ncbi:MAG: DNA-binding response regulator [Chloroflexi bacterium UTCFX4]|jgi:two-component system KDP operon response regulator KdpE|nr:MAG: DNA-binding response regulator [Chloroflexi bacterium UTCFX4]